MSVKSSEKADLARTIEEVTFEIEYLIAYLDGDLPSKETLEEHKLRMLTNLVTLMQYSPTELIKLLSAVQQASRSLHNLAARKVESDSYYEDGLQSFLGELACRKNALFCDVE